MVYLYAGLGVAMLAGIMAIFEMGLALTGRSLLPAPQDMYLSNAQVKLKDQRLLKLLVGNPAVVAPGLNAESLCVALRDAYQDAYLQGGESNPWVIASATPLTSRRWIGSCFLNDGSHRVLARQDGVDDSSPYQLYSCVVKAGSDLCLFEKE